MAQRILPSGRNFKRTKRTMQSRENKQGQRSKSKTSSFMKGIKSGVKKAIKNSPLNVGAMTSKVIKTAQKTVDKKRNNTFASLESGADTKRKAAEVRKKKNPKNQSLRPKARPKAKSLKPKIRPKKKG